MLFMQPMIGLTEVSRTTDSGQLRTARGKFQDGIQIHNTHNTQTVKTKNAEKHKANKCIILNKQKQNRMTKRNLKQLYSNYLV